MAQKKEEDLSKRMERLTEQSKQLRSNVTNNVFLIRRSPGQIEHVTREMASKISGQLNQTQIVKANSLLQKKGVDPEDLERKLVNLQVKSVEQLEYLDETDIEGFLKQKHLQLMLSAIEDTKTQSKERSNQAFLKSMDTDWKEMMEVIVHSLGADLESVMKQGAEVSSATRAFGGVMTDRSMGTKKMEDYARVLHILNQCRKNSQPYGLITKLSEVGRTSQSTRTALQDSWQLLKSMVGEKTVAREGTMTEGPSEERFLKEEPSAKAEFFVQGTLAFLHEQYGELIFRELNFKSSSVAIGGDPNIQSTISGYLELIYPNGFPADLERGSGKYPIYAFLYFCLRIGDYETAIEVAKREEMTDILKLLKQRYKDEGGSTVPSNLNNLTHLSTNTKDPYKHLLLNILGRLDPNKGYNTIPRWSVQDWLWFQLQMINKKPQPGARKDFTLQDLQRQVEKYGASHFNRDGKSPFLYFQILVMTQQFELAIDYGINNIQSQYIDIIHIAISLYYYGMLNLHEKAFLFQIKPPALNIVQLLSHYSKSLTQGRFIGAAVDYLVLIRDSNQKKQALEQLALETRDYLFLFGEKEGGQGIMKHGKLYEYVPEDEVKQIIANTAKVLEDENRTSDAILILDLIDEYSEVFRILIENLGKMLTPSSNYERDRRVLIDFTDSIFAIYTQSGAIHAVDPKRKSTLQTLCSLISFFNLYAAEDYAEALKFIIKLDLLPYQNTDIDHLANSFKTVDISIKNNFSQIATVTMKSLVYLSLKSGTVSLDSPWTRAELRQFGNAIILFLGRLSLTGNFNLPAEVYATLSQLELRLMD